MSLYSTKNTSYRPRDYNEQTAINKKIRTSKTDTPNPLKSKLISASASSAEATKREKKFIFRLKSRKILFESTILRVY